MDRALVAAFAGQLVMVAPEMQASFEAKLTRAEMAFAEFQRKDALTAPVMADDFWYSPDDWRSEFRPYVVQNGILQIPVKGVLLNNFPYALWSWATGYEYIWRAYQRGMDDSEVKGIALIVDSPGGLVAGNFDLVDKLFARRGEKPVRAYATEHMYSAAYSIGSVASDGLWVARTGGVGSIGVVAMHIDVSTALEKDGIKVTFIKKGAHKTDGNPYESMSKEVLARFEEKMEVPYGIFVATVARNRGMEEQAVRDTEAMTFTAPEATSNGLADHIGALDDALAEFAADLNQTDSEDEDHMAITPEEAAAHQAAVEAARAEGVAEGRVTGQKEGATAERTRITTIIGSDEGKVRPKAALSAALKSDMSADAAKAFLADLDEEKAQTTAPADNEAGNDVGQNFGNAMSQANHPRVGADPKGDNEPDDDAKASGKADADLARQYGLSGYEPAAK